ncbi:SusC/RagA family TonB-linked outer membrane protein [Hymenobacter convexus]|uniref:SusC/RagA family TonB-linked outer membrane protein n=1 Tax=Hymenobacter sp. CA1UV-4 TaxID=3063782 RepID=UPI002713A27A|nr:TonB-dependent receptor [Hymenobacter sp. CA1UV-4]MDO7849964.1 TonB-dependent receptor [Hymenobacter sp. CA1UV-4]
MKNVLFIVLLLVLSALGQRAAAQNRTVQGTVRDAQGPVPGVAVYEKDLTSNGTTTDPEGRYSLAIKGKSGILIFRSVNYKLSEVQVGTRTSVDVKLESADQSLDEVTVVGFGEQKKITQTGSVSQVSGKEIRENPSASLQNTLVGRLPGFFSQQPSGRPGADGAAFFIRGISSYNGNNQPLIIVDDVQYSYDQFQRLDPNEIESLSILKDAATTAIYGVRGANGVVVVTTRRGKDGPPQISARVEFGLTQPTKFTNYLDAAESARLYNQAQINDNEFNPVPGFKPRFSDDDLQKFRDGSDPYGHPNVNWRKVLFKDWSQQYRANVDMSGGSQRVKYFVSVGYLYQNGLLNDFGSSAGVNSNYFHQRYNYRSNLDINITKGLDARIDLYGNFGQVNIPRVNTPFSSAFNANDDVFYDYSSFPTLAPFAYPIYNPDGSYGYSKWSRDVNSGYNVNNIVGRLTNNGYRRNNENNINGVFSLKQDLGVFADGLKGLNVTGRLAYTSNYGYYRQMTRTDFPSFIYTPATATTPESYEARDPNLYRTRPFALGYSGGSTSRVVNLQAIVNYDRTFGKHHVYGLALYNRNANTAANGDYTYNFIPANFLGYSGRLGYDYDNRYLIQFNAGYNGSDRFSADNRYGLFPAVSAGWNVAEESFFRAAVPAVTYLKLRGSYGLVGNDALGNQFTYYYQQNYGSGSGYDFGLNSTGAPGIQEGRLANNDVTWEKEKKLDVAVEFRLFKDQLFGSADFFNNDRYDILTTRGTVSSIFGQSLPPVNLGRVNNRGYELELGYQSPISKDFSWSIKGNYSFAKNKILFQDEPVPQYEYQRFTGNSIGQQRVYVFQGFYSAADIASRDVAKPASGARPGDLKYEDLNGDGVINDFDRKVTGLPNLPNTTYGVNLGARYKGLSVSVLFQGASNFNVSGAAEAIKAFTANLSAVHQNAWTPELGDNAQYPRLTLLPSISDPSSNQSTFWQISGNYVRLKTAQINYDLPTSFMRYLGIPSARIYANGTNLLTWSAVDKLYDFDPEVTLNTSRPLYPPQRLINFGMSVTF